MSSEQTDKHFGHAGSALAIFVDSPVAASKALAALRDLGLSDDQITRYFGASPTGIAQIWRDQETSRGASE